MEPGASLPLPYAGPSALAFIRVRAALTLLEPLLEPGYSGFALKGALGNVLRVLACSSQGAPSCPRPHSCPYHLLLDTPSDPAGPWRAARAPHPLVLVPPADRPNPVPGDTLDAGLVLVGRGMAFLPHAVAALEVVGQRGMGPSRGRFAVARVEDWLGPGDGTSSPGLVYNGGPGAYVAFPRVVTWERVVASVSGVAPDRVALRLRSPLRLQYAGQAAETLDFPLFMRNLLRRLSWLAWAHCGGAWEADFRAMLERAARVTVADARLRWYPLTRRSSRQARAVRMDGLMGEVVFEGPLGEFLPILRLGEYLGVGKGTVYGLGQYECAW